MGSNMQAGNVIVFYQMIQAQIIRVNWKIYISNVKLVKYILEKYVLVKGLK